ncbi:MAG: hypothetical protein NTV88_00940 [Candidatus Micrarchaeota archaeon]|nr:hypothetical protein [Candidatus Micrarchaeota archaeon]
MENLEAMARLATRQGYLEMRMKEMKKRIDAGDSPESIREELKKCLSESLVIGEKLAVHYRAREKIVAKADAIRKKEVKEAAKENSKR